MANLKAAGRPPLPVELHASTRNEHTTLNRTIVARLPLCLPTATTTPTLYAEGMICFGQIYYGFEEAWDTLLSLDNMSRKERMILTMLDIPHLRRAKRLDASLQHLRTISGHTDDARFSMLQATASRFKDDIKKSILDRPYLLMAYTWTMYLALFNGGRWIAKQLLNAGDEFWNHGNRSAVARGPLSFWFFGDDEDYDGDDIKIAFKDRFNDAADTLSDIERDEIIAECKKIFGICAEMIRYLDQNAQGDRSVQETNMDRSCPVVRHDERGGVLGYLSSVTLAPLVSTLSSVTSRMSFTKGVLPTSLRTEIDRKNP